MNILKSTLLTVAATTLSFSAYAYDDPQTDFDSLYGIQSGSTTSEDEAVDIAALETVTSEEEHAQWVDPQTDFNSVHE